MVSRVSAWKIIMKTLSQQSANIAATSYRTVLIASITLPTRHLMPLQGPFSSAASNAIRDISCRIWHVILLQPVLEQPSSTSRPINVILAYSKGACNAKATQSALNAMWSTSSF